MNGEASLSDHLDEHNANASSRNLLSVEQAQRKNMTVIQHDQGVIISNEVQVGRMRSTATMPMVAEARSVSMMAESRKPLANLLLEDLAA